MLNIKNILFNIIHKFCIKELYFCSTRKRWCGNLLGKKIIFDDGSYEPNNKSNNTYDCGSLYYIIYVHKKNCERLIDGPSFKSSFGVMTLLKNADEGISATHSWAKNIANDSLNEKLYIDNREYFVATMNGIRSVKY